MTKKGKKKVKKSNRQINPQPLIPPKRESSPSDDESDGGDQLPMDVKYGIILLENKIEELKRARDSGADPLGEIKILPLLETELKVLKARIRDQNKNDKDKDKAGPSVAGFMRKFDSTISSEQENEYYEDLRDYLDTWKVLACEGRKEGNKSLIELLRSVDVDRSDGERARAFDSMRETLIEIGTKISSLAVEYFTLFVGILEDSEIVMRTRTIKNTLLIASLDEVNGSPVIDRFIEVIESAIIKIRVSEDRDVKGKGKGKAVDDGCEDHKETGNNIEVELLFGKRESNLLCSIFFKVLYLEVTFCCPSFPEKLETKDLMDTRDYLTKLFEEKIGELSSELNEFKKECESVGELDISKRSELKEILESEIKEIWEGLDLFQSN